MPKVSRCSEELRERAVRLLAQLRERVGAMEGIAKLLGVSAETLTKWVRRNAIDGGGRAGLSTNELLRERERENRALRRANEILKAVSVFFATEIDNRQKKWSASSTSTADLRSGEEPICSVLQQLSNSLRSDLAIDALEMTYRRFKDGFVVRIDANSECPRRVGG
jgi:transposase